MTISTPKFPLKRSALYALALPALLALSPLSAKTLVYCSEGSPENFAPSINTTGTSFDASEQIYDNIVDFERGGTKVVPGLAEKWEVSKDGLEYTFHLRKGVKWHSNKNFKPSRDFNSDDILILKLRIANPLIVISEVIFKWIKLFPKVFFATSVLWFIAYISKIEIFIIISQSQLAFKIIFYPCKFCPKGFAKTYFIIDPYFELSFR